MDDFKSTKTNYTDNMGTGEEVMTVKLEKVDMRWNRNGPCRCGANEEVYTAYDSKGICLSVGCESCLPEKLKGFRSDVLYGPDYDTEEQIEEDE